MLSGLNPLIQQVAFVESPNVKFDIDKGDYTLYDTEKDAISMRVQRGSDDANIVALIFILTDINGNTHSHKVYDIPKPNNAKVYKFGTGIYDEIISVNVIPIYDVNGVERESSINSNKETNIRKDDIDEDTSNLPTFGATRTELLVNGGAETGDTTGWETFGYGWTGVSSAESFDGTYSFEAEDVARTRIRSSEFIEIDYDAKYLLSAWFKSIGDNDSKYLVGYVPYLADKITEILPEHVYTYANTETTLYEDAYSNASYLLIDDIGGDGCSNWINNSGLTTVAFNINNDYSDLPNRNLHTRRHIIITDLGDHCNVSFNNIVNRGYALVTYPEGTKVREHFYGGTYQYPVRGNPTLGGGWVYDEVTFTEECEGSQAICLDTKFRKGTKYVKVLIFANEQGHDPTFLHSFIDNISLIEEKVIEA